MKNRWVVLGSAIIIQTILGGIYSWSTFVPWLTKTYGLSAGQCGFIFGLTIAMFTVTMTLAGRVLNKKGPRFTASIGAILFTTGYILASVSKGSFIGLLISISVVVGAGIGFGYVSPLSVGIKWFPKKKGLVTGVAVAGFGGGAIMLSIVAEHFLHDGINVLLFFRWLGIFSGIILFAAAFNLVDPPSTKSNTSKVSSVPALLTVPFGIISLGMFAGTFAGLLIIGNLTPLVILAGLTEAEAVISVSIFALGNGLGRIMWGHFFDKLSYKSIPLSLGIFGLLILLLLLPLSKLLLLSLIGCLGFGFGANFVVYASAVSRHFGTELFSKLYPICFLAYGFAGIVGPGIGGILADVTKSYDMGLYVSFAILIIVSIISFVKLHRFNTIYKLF